MTTNFTKISQLPTISTAADADRIVILTNTDTVPLLQTISYHMLSNSLSQGYVNTGSPVISNSITVNSSFIANNIGVYASDIYSNSITTNTVSANVKLNVGAQSGYNFGLGALIEVHNNQNTYTQYVLQNANSGTNASGDLVLVADTGNDSVNYVDLGINSSQYTNTIYSITGYLDAYLYSSNSNLIVGTATNKSIIFHANGTSTTDRKFTINATSVTVANNVLFNANSGAFAGQVNTGTLNVNGNLTVSGNVTLSGNTTFVNATIITTDDLNIILANNAISAAAADGAGIVAGNYANLVYDNGTNTWQSNVGITPTTTDLYFGNTSLRWNIIANNINVSSVTATANLNVGANVYMTTQQVYVGNSISSTLIGNNSIAVGNSVNNVTINSTAVMTGSYTSAANGYTTMMNGLKMNWGWVSSNSSVGAVTFTSAFTTNAYTVTATSNTTTATYQPAVTAWTKTGATILTANGASTNVFWMAIGV